MYYGKIRNCDIANGKGVRVSLFVSGCRNHCKNCFQPETWDFKYGQPYTDETEEYIIQLLSEPYIQGLTILGGEPLEPENQRGLIRLLQRVKSEYPEKDVMHCAEAYWTSKIRRGDLYHTKDGKYMAQMTMPESVYRDYVCGSFTKTVCEARNKNQLLKAKDIADELGLVEDIDYGCIYDKCLTELEPEEDDGTTLTGMWFCPLDDEIAHKISKKYQLYK